MLHHLVAALIIRGERILLGQRSTERAFYPNVWDVFGGHIEPDEQAAQALIRELQEELAITPTQWEELETIRETVLERDDKLDLAHPACPRLFACCLQSRNENAE